MVRTEVSFEVKEIIGVIGEKQNGWTKEVTLTSWNGGQPKIDIREWDPNHERCGRGITLPEEEARRMTEILIERFGLKGDH